MKRILSTILVIALLVSASGGAVAQTDIPAGMVGVPDANVSEDVPVGSTPALTAEELQGSVMASEYAETLEVIITTPDRASEYLGNGTELSGSQGLSLVLRDDVHSAGRRVAIDAGAVKDALGYTPKRIYGVNEDGSRWSSAVEYQGGMLMFEVPHFSSNSITFAAEVSVTGTYTSGSTINYGVSSPDAVSNYSLNVTGSLSSEWDNQSWSNVAPGATLDPQIAGNVEPVGPGGGEPNLTVTGVGNTTRTSIAGDLGTSSREYNYVTHILLRINDRGPTNDGNGPQNVTYEIRVEDTGEVLKSDTVALGDQYADFSEAHQVNYGTTRELDSEITAEITANPDNGRIDYFDTTTYPEVSVEAGGTTHNLGLVTGTESRRVDISTSDTISYSFQNATVNTSLDVRERSKTIDPSVSINGHTTSYSGTLSDGSKVSLSTDGAWIVDGTNTVNVSVGDGTLSADAPAPSVGLNYSHNAQDKQSVQYTGTKWTEAYNVSKTFASDRSSASLTIPFDSEVVEIESLEMRTNGGSWSAVSTTNYDLSNTKLTVDLGSVSGGDTVEVRTTGQQVLSVNSAVTVLEATSPGDRLDTKVQIESWSDDAYLSVGRTADSGRLHYTYNESWQNADEHVEITDDGKQRLYLPGASTLSDFRVQTVPVRVNARSGEVEISMHTPSTTEPAFYVSPGATSNDDIEYTLLTAADGEEYILRSETNNVVHDSGTASSPITLVDDDSEELLVIEQDSTTASSDDGPASIGIGPAQIDTDTPLNSVPVILLVGAVILVGLVFIYRRLGWSIRDATGPIPVDPVFALATGLIAFVVVDYTSGGALTGALAANIKQIGSGFSQIVPLLGIIGGGLAAYWFYKNFILGDSGGGGGKSRVRTIVLREGKK